MSFVLEIIDYRQVENRNLGLAGADRTHFIEVRESSRFVEIARGYGSLQCAHLELKATFTAMCTAEHKQSKLCTWEVNILG